MALTPIRTFLVYQLLWYSYLMVEGFETDSFPIYMPHVKPSKVSQRM